MTNSKRTETGLKEALTTRWGKFYIPYHMIDGNPTHLRVIISSMAFVAHAKMLPKIKMVEYICRSNFFDPVEPKDEIPEYIMIVTKDGEVKVEKGEVVKKEINE